MRGRAVPGGPHRVPARRPNAARRAPITTFARGPRRPVRPSDGEARRRRSTVVTDHPRPDLGPRPARPARAATGPAGTGRTRPPVGRRRRLREPTPSAGCLDPHRGDRPGDLAETRRPRPSRRRSADRHRRCVHPTGPPPPGWAVLEADDAWPAVAQPGRESTAPAGPPPTIATPPRSRRPRSGVARRAVDPSWPARRGDRVARAGAPRTRLDRDRPGVAEQRPRLSPGR